MSDYTAYVDGLPLLNVLILLLSTFFVSFLVSAIGPTGGLQMAAVAGTMPAPLLIPLHAWITGWSALFRTISLWPHIEWKFFWRFLLPSLVGAIAVSWFIASSDFMIIHVTVAIYVLINAVLLLFGVPLAPAVRRPAPVAIGLATGALSMIIGASGPVLVTLMQSRFENKEQLVATFSACLTWQHLSKLVLFGAIGVSVLGYPVLLISTLVAAGTGTLLGRSVLLRLPERVYRLLLATILAAVSVGVLFSLARPS